MVMYCTALTKTFLSIDGCQIVVEKMMQVRDVFFSSVAQRMLLSVK